MIGRINAPLGRWARSSFRICGYTGLGLGIGTAFVLAWRTGLSLGVIALMALVATSASFVVAILTKAAVGGEQWIFYHHALAVTGAVVLLLRGLGQPVLPYLDIAAVSLAVLLACGRVGCLLVGCCHGRPSDWGVCYAAEHVNAGFPSDLEGVCLLPVQSFECLWVTVMAIAGGGIVWIHSASGVALSWCLIAYGGERFLVEFWRGDQDRAYPRGLAEAQWTSLLLVALATACQLVHWLPYTPWQLATVLAWSPVAAGVWLWQVRHPTLRRVCRPNHVREVALALGKLCAPQRRQDAAAEGVAVERTSEGIQISATAVSGADGPVLLYTLSDAKGEMPVETARAVACLIQRLRHPGARIDLMARKPGIFHLLLDGKGQ